MRALLVLLVSLTACSGGGSGTTSGTSADYCTGKRERAARCEAGTVDAANCDKEAACFNGALRPELRDELITCVNSRACGSSDDPCFSTAAQKYASDPDVTAYSSACVSKRTACGNNFSDDRCAGEYAIVTNELRAKMKACLDRACGDISACFEAAFTSVGCAD